MFWSQIYISYALCLCLYNKLRAHGGYRFYSCFFFFDDKPFQKAQFVPCILGKLLKAAYV
jgi:hypothetical protein